jgi:hypothetical protein
MEYVLLYDNEAAAAGLLGDGLEYASSIRWWHKQKNSRGKHHEIK